MKLQTGQKFINHFGETCTFLGYNTNPLCKPIIATNDKTNKVQYYHSYQCTTVNSFEAFQKSRTLCYSEFITREIGIELADIESEYCFQYGVNGTYIEIHEGEFWVWMDRDYKKYISLEEAERFLFDYVEEYLY